MEKKLSSTSSRLRSLKEFLSSTRGLNHQAYDTVKKPPHSSTNFRSSIRNTKNSISLFNLIAVNGNDRLTSASGGGSHERPISMAFDEQYGYAYEDREIGPCLLPNKSVSMYHVASMDACSNADSVNLHPTSSTRNLAARLFYNLRSKFRRRRRDRNKIVDSKSTDFGALFPEEKNPHQSVAAPPPDSDGVRPSCARYQLKSATSLDTILSNPTLLRERDPGAIKDVTESNAEPVVDDGSVAGTSRSNNFDDLNQTLKSLSDFMEVSRGGDESPIETNAPVNILHEDIANNPVVPHVPSKPVKCLTKELENLLHYGWYWGGLSKDEAEAKLKDQPDGAFVVRDSSSDHYLLSLSFNSNGKTLHTRIEYRNGQFCFYMSPDSDTFNTVAELIQHCIAYSEVGIFCYSKPRRSHHNSTSYPVRLTKPISRFTEVKSLLYLSRLVIRQYVRFDLIPHLPLPASLVEFVSEQRYI